MIILSMIGFVILYFVIFTAVRDGINRSVIGQRIEKEHGVQQEKKSFLDQDLDH